MATLAADKPRQIEPQAQNSKTELPMIASDIIYAGAAVGELNNTGTYQPLNTGSTVDRFAGFATAQADNSAGAASAINVKLVEEGRVKLSVTGVASAADRGKTVWATDDDTFTLTYASGAISIGVVDRWIVGTTCMVEFKSFKRRSVISVSIPWNASSVDEVFFVANAPYCVVGAKARVTAAGTDGSAVTGAIKHAGDGTAISGGTAIHSGTFDLKGTANTAQALTLSTTSSDLKLAAGEGLGIDFAGTLTTATGIATVDLRPL
jgi:hypothetical protein